MTTNQLFAEFQITFLHLASEGQIHKSNLQMDLYNKLSTDLQKGMASYLVDLNTYDKLRPVVCLLTLNSGESTHVLTVKSVLRKENPAQTLQRLRSLS
jgi:hypothetical protein